MPENIEIKARIRDFTLAKKLAGELTGSDARVILQEDVFFKAQKGRLKLRKMNTGRAELIYYLREDKDGPKSSMYSILPVDNPEQMKSILDSAFGIRGIVKKTRFLYLYGTTRIHLDEVEGLGYFLELEYVINDEISREESYEEVKKISSYFGLGQSDLIASAYIDLLLQQQDDAG